MKIIGNSDGYTVYYDVPQYGSISFVKKSDTSNDYIINWMIKNANDTGRLKFMIHYTYKVENKKYISSDETQYIDIKSSMRNNTNHTASGYITYSINGSEEDIVSIHVNMYAQGAAFRYNKRSFFAFPYEKHGVIGSYTYNLPKTYDLSPPSLSASIDGSNLTISADASSSGEDAYGVQIAVYQNHGGDTLTQHSTKNFVVASTHLANWILKLPNNNATYKVRARSYESLRKSYSEWSEFTDVYSRPPIVSNFRVKVMDTSVTDSKKVLCQWTSDYSVYTDGYTIQYTTDKQNFDAETNDGITAVTIGDPGTNAYTLDGLDTGVKYFFRIVGSSKINGDSDWSSIISLELGTKPDPPTTWSSVSVATPEDKEVILYWSHNSTDGSDLTKSRLTYNIEVDGKVETSARYELDPPTDGSIPCYTIDISSYTKDAKIYWQVQTKGLESMDWSKTSLRREIDVYTPPSLSMTITDNNSDNKDSSKITALPINIRLQTEAQKDRPQHAIGYGISIVADDDSYYRIYDASGNEVVIHPGDEIYSKTVYTSSVNEYAFKIGYSDILLKNGMSYIVKGTIYMSSGLSTSVEQYINVNFLESNIPIPTVSLEPDIESGYTMGIQACVFDENGNCPSSIELSIYRIMPDGELLEIISNVHNSDSFYVTDPHPSLRNAKYRVVATDKNTGLSAYVDTAGINFDDPAIIIQWDENWNSYSIDPISYIAGTDASGNIVLSEVSSKTTDFPWSGSLLRLPYNIDVTESNTLDTSLVEYIGRKHPVGYYGTQQGSSASWNTSVPADDDETIFLLRRLAIYPGDVYVREPSGIGYWANISVSFNKNHGDVIIPVTLDIKRVEGGI